MSVEIQKLAQLAYEKHVSFIGFEHPRLGMRTATWEELPEKTKQEWCEVVSTIKQADCKEENFDKQSAADDIILKFYSEDYSSGYFLRVASRHGKLTTPSIVKNIEQFLRTGVTLSAHIETPSRFAL